MNSAEAYIPTDRRAALVAQRELPTKAWGAVLFVDISGFTPLTIGLQRAYGPRRGAEELTRQLNRVYTALINAVEAYGGSVIGFSGDGITCWFDSDLPDETPPQRSATQTTAAVQAGVCAALAVQAAMAAVQTILLADGTILTLSVRTSLAAGAVRRFAVGDPAIQLIDVLAGATLDRVAAADQVARVGGVVLDAMSVAAAQAELRIEQWLPAHEAEGKADAFALVTGLHTGLAPRPLAQALPLPEAVVRSWVLPAIYERIQNQQGRFLAELRPAAALFLKFTGIDYDHDEAAPAKLNRYITWVQQIVNQHEGALIQLTTGDKGSYLYAAFGAPIAHDDDMLRAVAVGHALRWPPPDCPFITAVHIGISYGMMRVGAYGSEGRRTYGVLGSETITAARLMTYAQPGQVVISQGVTAAVGEDFALEALGSVLLKGNSSPQPLFRVLARRQHVEQLTQLYATPLVGRAAELAKLEALLPSIQAGKGVLARIEGSAGLGKSHLAAEFARRAEHAGLRIISGAGQSTAQDTAYLALRQPLAALFALADEPAAQQIAQLEERIASQQEGWRLRLPLLGDLLGLPIPDNATTAAFDARLRQEALITLTVEIFAHYGSRQPLLLILEDIHWLDEASKPLVLTLARVVHTLPLLFLTLHRPAARENEGFLQELAALPQQHTIQLEELSAPGIAELVTAHLQGPVTALAQSLISLQAQGNPFFTEELVDALVESKQLVQQTGEWQLNPTLVQRLRSAGCLIRSEGEEIIAPQAPLTTVDLGIPSTIQGIILGRLDRLPEAMKLTLKVASVIGRIFGHELLVRAHPAQGEADRLAGQLELLMARDFARLESAAPRRTYLFKHNITQEVVYQTLLTDQRQELHMGVATALEELQPDRVEELALHYYNSNLEQPPLRTKALHYLEAAGLRAKRDYANETALNYFNQAIRLDAQASWLQAKIEVLHILGRRDEEKESLQQLTELSNAATSTVALLWGKYYEARSDYEQAQQQIEQALSASRDQDDLRGEIQCLSQLGLILARQANYEAARAQYEHALAQTARDPQLDSARAEILYGLSSVNRRQGNYREAQAQLEITLQLNRAYNNRASEAATLTALGVINHLMREYDLAERYYQQSLTIRHLIGDRSGEASSLLSLGQLARSHGNYSKATTTINEALAIFQLLGDRWWQSIGHNELGIIALYTGQREIAQHNFQESLALSRKISDAAGEAIALVNLGQVLRDQGQSHQARQLIQQSLKMAQQQSDKDLEAQCWSDLAICLLREKAYDEAITCSQQALTLFEEFGVETALTTDLCTLAQLYLQVGQLDQAKQYAERAWQILNACQGDGPDYPHRDYFTCYRVFTASGDSALAAAALHIATQLLLTQAERIDDPAIRHSYLQNVAFNQEIIHTAQQKHLPLADALSKDG